MAFDPKSDIGCAYLSYVEDRSRVWAEKYLDGRQAVDYRGDSVLERYHFCNVWRELDRYSRWELEHIKGRPLARQLDVIVIGRMTMVPSTIRLLMGGADRTKLIAHRDRCRAWGIPWYSSALNVSAYGGRDFVDEFISHRDSYARNRLTILGMAKRMGAQEFAVSLQKLVYKVGPFRAYEVTTSLTYSEHTTWTEDDVFIIGPGAIGGWNLVTGDDMEASHSGRVDPRLRGAFEGLRDHVVVELLKRGRMRWIPEFMQPQADKRWFHKFTLRTLEDSLCEFRKYWNIRTGASKGRRAYRPRDLDA